MLKVTVDGLLGEGKSTLAGEISRILEREGFKVHDQDIEAGPARRFEADHTTRVEKMKDQPVFVTTQFSEELIRKTREAPPTPSSDEIAGILHGLVGKHIFSKEEYEPYTGLLEDSRLQWQNLAGEFLTKLARRASSPTPVSDDPKGGV